MDAVYLLWHSPHADDDEGALLVGVYRTENSAKEAIARLGQKPGFAQRPEGFEICKYELDRDQWTEGYKLD